MLSPKERELASATVAVRAALKIQTIIVKREIDRIVDHSNVMLEGTGIDLVEIAWSRPTADPEPICDCGFRYATGRYAECPSCGAARGRKLSDDLEILVSDDSGEVEDVKFKSGGAKRLTATAIRFSALALLRDVRGAAINWATIDEPFGPLDEENSELLARQLGTMISNVGLEQAFVVSHNAALIAMLPNKIVVERSDGVSTLRME
jgi:hypothetical protein